MSAHFPEQAEDLLAQITLGNRQAFRTLYDLTASHLFAVAMRILKNRERAEEALQDAFVQIWNKADQFQSQRGCAGAWMSTIVRYRALDMLRRMPQNQTSLEDLPPGQNDPVDERDDIDRTLVGEDLAACFEELSDQQREAVAMAYLEGLSHPELSERLSAPLGTVKSWVRRGLMALRACLGR